MLSRLYNWWVDRHRDYKYRSYLAKHEQGSSGAGGAIIPANPAALFGYGMGKHIGDRMGALSRASDSWYGRLLIVYHGPVAFFAFLCIGAVLYSVLVSPFTQGSTGALLPLIFAVTPILHAHSRARDDLRTTKRLRNATQPTDPDVLALAYENLDHRQRPARYAAFGVLQRAFTDSPGKAVKRLSEDPDEIGDTFVAHSETDDATIVESCVICSKWLSRDFAAALYPHRKRFLEYLSSDSSVLQANAAVIVGNVGASDGERVDEYAKALQSVVRDPDADVRQAAVTALANLPCKRSAKLLKHLTDDSDPEVRRNATAAFQRMLSGRGGS